MTLYWRVFLAFLLCWGVIGSAAASAFLPSWGSSDPEFLEAADVFRLDAVQEQGPRTSAAGHVADGYYVYRHSIRLVDARGSWIDLDLPAGQPKHDEFFGDTQIYMGSDLRLRWPTTAPGPLTLHWQGCADGGICYPPQKMQVTLPIVRDAPAPPAAGARSPFPVAASVDRPALPAIDDAAPSPQADAAQAPPVPKPAPETTDAGVAVEMAEDQAAAEKLSTLGPVTGVLLFFGFGLLLAFTPCTLPMIPIVSTLVVGNQAGPRRAFLLSLTYVLAMAGTYAAVGVAAGLAGANLQAMLQSPWLLGAFAALFLILASSLFGLFELRLPAALVNRIGASGQERAGGRVAGAAVLGFLSALLVGPCMTAPLAGALLYIGQTGSALYGGLALFALGLGMGLPLLAIAVFGARVLPRPGAWMETVRVAFGYVMVGMAVMMLSRFLPGTVGLLLWGMWILSISIGLIAWGQAVAARRRLAWALRSVAVFAGLWSVLMLVGAAAGGESSLQPLAHLRTAASTPGTAGVAYVQAKSIEDVDARIAEAGARGQWTLIDFYADWCVSCHVIEREVFGHPEVSSRLAGMQVVRPDVTRNDEQDQALLKRWQVQGPPTIILLGPDGRERRAQRVVGEVDADDFMARLDRAGAP